MLFAILIIHIKTSKGVVFTWTERTEQNNRRDVTNVQVTKKLAINSRVLE